MLNGGLSVTSLWNRLRVWLRRHPGGESGPPSAASATRISRHCCTAFISHCCLIALVIASGCGGDTPQNTRSAGPPLPTASFDDYFALTRRVTLEQPFEYPIAVLSGLSLTSEGNFVITDRSEGRVSVFDPDGKLVTTFGGRGQGPGEFQLVGAPRVDARDRIHVVDIVQRRISMFSLAGALLRETPLPNDLLVWEMELTPSGYLMTAFPNQATSNDVLWQVDSVGKVLSRALPIARAIPEGQTPTQRWEAVNTTRLTAVGDTAFVVHSLFDSLWAVTRSGNVTSRSITTMGYQPPTMADPEPRTPVEIVAWAQELMMIPAILGSSEFLLVPFAQGRYEERGDPSAAAFRDRHGTWHTLLDTPIVVGVSGETLVTLERSDIEQLTLGIYRYRGG